MKKNFTILLFLFAQGLFAQSFQAYFDTARLRVDLVFAGNAEQQSVYFAGLHKEPQWGGSQTNLIDPFDYGEYCYKVFSPENRLIFSRGFSSLFYEWRTTEEAKILSRAHPFSLLLPMPKREIRLEIYERIKKTNEWHLLFATKIHPSDKQIREDAPAHFAVTALLHHGHPSQKVDVALLAEGYTAGEMEKFRADAARLTGHLFAVEPFASHRSDFNIWAVEAVSEESGPDIPHEGIWKNTAAGAGFYTFGIDRYLTAPSHTRLCELAWNTPYDILYVLVNTGKYGGGGIYNFYGLSMSGHPLAKDVFPHEFGHTFAGLADEYYTSEVAYRDFYDFETEPWEPNLTTLVDFAKKWRDMVNKDTPVPTPNTAMYADTVGVFEGGGYISKGVFRPALDCRMKSNTTKGFCPVCRRAIVKMIDAYCR
ncbi:MAG: IgA Peptidase M64 [Prevotellaceae bacterium]|nr:IgA Peptidase M64 [Prevotellaceae bacterium]